MISVHDEAFVFPLQIKVCELMRVWDQQHGSEWGQRGGRGGGALQPHQSSEVRWGSPTVHDSFPCQISELKALHHQYSHSKLCVRCIVLKVLYTRNFTKLTVLTHVYILTSDSCQALCDCVLRRAIEIKLDFTNLNTFIFSKLHVWVNFDFISVLQDLWGTRFC